MRRWVLLFLLLAPALALAAKKDKNSSQEVSRSTSPIPFETDRLIYDEKQGLVFFEDRFKVQRDSESLTGDRMVYNENTQIAVATGNLVFQAPTIVLKGVKLGINTAQETFHWENGVNGSFANETWRFRAKNLDGTSEMYKARRVVFTSCNEDHPHYSIWAWNGKIYPGEQATFRHAIFRIGPVPFWYWPWFSKSLNDKPKPTFYIEPGQNGREGSFLKTAIRYPLKRDRLYLRTHFDYFSKIDSGFGQEVLYKDDHGSMGALSFYTIKEKSGLRQYDVRGDGYFYLSSSLSAQGSLRYQRDQGFNNFYSKDNPEKINPDLRSSGSLNWRRGPLQLRSFYSDVWAYDHVKGKFWSTNQILPGFESVISPIPLLGSNFFLNGNIVSQMHKVRPAPYDKTPFDRWEDSGSMSINRPWKLGLVRWINGSIGTNISHSYVTNISETDHGSSRSSTYGGSASMRMNPGDLLDLDLTYSHNLRSEIGSLRQDTTATDRGLSQRKITAREMSQLPLRTFMYVQSGYNLPAPCPRTACANPIDWTQSLDPVFGFLSMSPFNGAAYSFSTSYNVFDRKYLHNVNLSQYVFPASFSANFGYDNRRPNYLLPTFTGQIGIPGIFESIQATVRTEYFSNKQESLSINRQTLRYFERELVFVPDLHDFWITLVFRARRVPVPVQEFFFNIRLRLSARSQRKEMERMKENEYYPWRAGQPQP